ISIVSKIRCRTRHRDEEQGWELVLEGGKTIRKKPIKFPVGTQMEVSGLFFNVPARRKFLKSTQTERRTILTLLNHIGLIHHDIHLSLFEKKGQKTTKLMESPSRKTLLASIFDILGNEVASQLIPLEGMAGRWIVEGYVSVPSLIRKDRSNQFISVNGRIVKVVDINKAVEEGYGSRLLKGNHPVFIVNLKGDNSWVDYNVHPQKIEVRFESKDNVLDEIAKLVNQVLEGNASLPKLTETKSRLVTKNSPSSIPTSSSPPIAISIDERNDEAKDSFIQTTLSSIVDGTEENRYEVSVQVQRGFRVLGQIMKKFALVEKDEELWLVDLHAADERVKFEQFAKSKDKLIMNQQFLEPIKVNLGKADLDLLNEYIPILKQFGMEISVTENNVFIHSLPVYFDQKITAETIQNFLFDIIAFYSDTPENIVSSPFDDLEYKVVSRLACHGSVRAGVFITNSKIAEILSNLLKCQDPWTCAHGRPTVIRIDRQTMEKWFKRIGQ
ncbi:MAG: hypothetical protein D6732_02565, partial [Methanobacteriota archaeon]